MHDISLGATSCGNGSMGWKKYDEQFRLRRSRDPSILLSKIDYELWFMQSPQQFTATQCKCGSIVLISITKVVVIHQIVNIRTGASCGGAYHQQTCVQLGKTAQSQ